MKTILMVCDRSNIDQPIRRSLAHLANSCQIKIISDGFQVYHELINSAFDLIIVDFEIKDIDSLELVESIGYIDPGVPVIFLLKQAHWAVWEPARRLGASPLSRPFKPLAFLRLVDTLLHQQLQRYRDLAEALAAVLATLADQPGVSYTFPVDDGGQIVLATCARDDPWLAMLGELVASRVKLPEPKAAQLDVHVPDRSTAIDHILYTTSIFENLLLGLLAPVTMDELPVPEIWQHLEQAAATIRSAIGENVFVKSRPPVPVNLKMSLPLRLSAESLATGQGALPEKDEVAVNWEIISNKSDTLGRLQRILSG